MEPKNGADISSASRNTVPNDGRDSSNDTVSSINAFPSYDTLFQNAESKGDIKVTISCDQIDKQNELECLGNKTSCVGGVENTNMVVGEYKGDVDKKNISCSSATDISTERTVDVQPGLSSEFDSGKLAGDDCESPNKFTKDCLQEKPTVVSYKQENAPTSDFHVVDGQREDTGLLKAEGPLAEATDKSDLLQKCNMVVEKCNEQKTSLQVALVDHAVELDIHEYEKVCDTCGDAGYRHLLSLCSKCTDGAEHTYCMRVKLHALPGADWVCQECLLSEEAKKLRLENFKEVDEVSKASSLKGAMRNRRKSKDLDVKDSAAEKSRNSKHASHSSTKSSEGKLKSFDRSAKSSKMRRKHPTAKDVLRKSKSANSRVSRMQFRVSRMQFRVPEEIDSRNHDLSEPRSSGKREGVVKLQKSMFLNDAPDRINVRCSNFRKLSSDLPRVENAKDFGSACYPLVTTDATKSVAGKNIAPQRFLLDSIASKSSLNVPSSGSFIPQPESVWKGEFSIEKRVTLPSSCLGIEAHVSTIASGQVPKFTEKLPRKILLEEVTRSSAWPTQFPKNQTTEDNIALYFFANDLKSYERSYGKLVESMTNNDLALRGNFDGVELLIFSSTLLPEKSRRWNHLLFLWGVFRRKKGTPNLPKDFFLSSSSDQDLRAPSSIHNSLNKCSSGVSSETSNLAPLPELPAVLSVTFVDSCLLKVCSPEQKSTNLSDRVSNVDTAEQPEMMPEPFQTGEKYSKRRREIDLNHSADEEYTCKKIKNVRNEDVKESQDGFSSEICGLGSKFSDRAAGSNGVQSCESKVYSPEYQSTNLSHRLSDIGAATKDEHLDRDVLLQAYPSQKGETQRKRRWEIDLNCSPPKEEDSPKKMKNIFNEDVKDSGIPHGNVSSDTSIISMDLGSTCGSTWLKFPQYPSYSNDTLESRVVNAESLIPLIHGAVLEPDRSKLSNDVKNNDEDVDGPAEILLSLSLALPSSSSQEPEPQTKLLLPEWRKYIGDQ